MSEERILRLKMPDDYEAIDIRIDYKQLTGWEQWSIFKTEFKSEEDLELAPPKQNCMNCVMWGNNLEACGLVREEGGTHCEYWEDVRLFAEGHLSEEKKEGDKVD